MDLFNFAIVLAMVIAGFLGYRKAEKVNGSKAVYTIAYVAVGGVIAYAVCFALAALFVIAVFRGM